jgi:uncharacterized protein YdhG (YjbR/CyaY superfamily)
MIDEYIANFPNEIQDILNKIRHTIEQAAPEAEETISYKMPAFKLHNMDLVFFAAFQKHIGLYPPISADPDDDENEILIQDVSVYRGPKGNLKFPLTKPIPYDLITKIVKCRVKEVKEKQRLRAISEERRQAISAKKKEKAPRKPVPVRKTTKHQVQKNSTMLTRASRTARTTDMK